MVSVTRLAALPGLPAPPLQPLRAQVLQQVPEQREGLHGVLLGLLRAARGAVDPNDELGVPAPEAAGEAVSGAAHGPERVLVPVEPGPGDPLAVRGRVRLVQVQLRHLQHGWD